VAKEQKVNSSRIIIETAVLSPLRKLIVIPGMEISSTNGHKWNEE
jgi:uncharacterized membrane protein (DUF373 family)